MIGGNYEEAIERLRNERLVTRFALKFIDDGSYKLLEDSLASGNYEEAFRAAHTLKGVAANLAFTDLAADASVLTEALRPGHEDQRTEENLKALFEKVELTYAGTISGIKQLQ